MKKIKDHIDGMTLGKLNGEQLTAENFCKASARLFSNGMMANDAAADKDTPDEADSM